MGENFVLIGPNGWPIVIAGVLFSILGYWLWRSTNPRPAGSPSLLDKLSALRSVNTSAPVMSPSPVQTTPDQQPPEAGINRPVSVSVSVSGTDTAGFDLASVPSDLTYEEVVTILAGQVTPAGKPTYSGKRIYTLVGGNYNEFTALMRRLRAKDNEPAEPPPTTTPIAGRTTRATFKETDPELAYEPPPK
jgi:hypothetical protein